MFEAIEVYRSKDDRLVGYLKQHGPGWRFHPLHGVAGRVRRVKDEAVPRSIGPYYTVEVVAARHA